MQFREFPGMKMQFAVAVGKLCNTNRFMQNMLIRLNVFEPLIETLNTHAASDPALIKMTCFAIGVLVSHHHAAQTKFAGLGGCKALCCALSAIQDVNSLPYVLRTIATLSVQNLYVQDCFQLESAVEVLQSTKAKIRALSDRCDSFESKSKLNLLQLTCEYSLDAVSLQSQRSERVGGGGGGASASGENGNVDVTRSDSANEFASLDSEFGLAGMRGAVVASTSGNAVDLMDLVSEMRMNRASALVNTSAGTGAISAGYQHHSSEDLDAFINRNPDPFSYY